MLKSRSTFPLTVGISALGLVLAGCSTSGSTDTTGASVEGDSVNLATENCPPTATEPLEDGEDIRIGSSVALSGPVSAASQDAIGAVRGYFEMVNDNGGIAGHEISLDAQDDAYETARAVSNVKSLIDTENVMATLLQLGTAHSSAVQDMHEKSCTPQLYVSSGAPNFYDPQEHQFSTANFFPYSANGQLMVDFLEAEYPDGAKVGELVWNNEFGETATKAFEAAAEGTSVEVVGTEQHDATAVSLASQVTNLLATSPDALVASTGSSFCSQFVSSARNKGFDGPILLPNACSDASDVLAPLGDKAANVFAGQSLVDPGSGVESDGVAAFDTWMDEYGSGLDPKSSNVRTGYQMAALLVSQLERAAGSKDGLSKVSLMEAVWSTDAEIGLNFPGQKTTINGDFPYPTGYAVMSEYNPAKAAWMSGDVAILADGEQP